MNKVYICLSVTDLRNLNLVTFIIFRTLYCIKVLGISVSYFFFFKLMVIITGFHMQTTYCPQCI